LKRPRNLGKMSGNYLRPLQKSCRLTRGMPGGLDGSGLPAELWIYGEIPKRRRKGVRVEQLFSQCGLGGRRGCVWRSRGTSARGTDGWVPPLFLTATRLELMYYASVVTIFLAFVALSPRYLTASSPPPYPQYTPPPRLLFFY